MNNLNLKRIIKNQKANKHLISSAIALSLTYSSYGFTDTVNEQGKCITVDNCQSADSLNINDNQGYFNARTLDNSERILANNHWTFHGLAPAKPTAVITTTVEQKELKLDRLPSLSFSSGKHALSDNSEALMSEVIAQLADKKNVRLHFVGHADGQHLSKRARKIYKTNVGLSKFRASAIAQYIQEKLELPLSAVSTEGKGSKEPLASNNNKKGRANNRRVELFAWYDEEIKHESISHKPAFIRQNVCQYQPVETTPFSVTIDGQPMSVEQVVNNADYQRCTDVALNQADMQLQYDNLSLKPALNITSVVRHEDDNVTVWLQGYTNYSYFIERAEVRFFTVTTSVQGTPYFVQPLDKSLSAKWKSPQKLSELKIGEKLHYRFRVYNKNGTFDESQTFELSLTQQTSPDTPIQEALLAGYGESHLAMQNIPLSGGTLTVNGSNIPAEHQAYFLGQQLPINKTGQFVSQQIIPSGFHNIEVAILDDSGNGELFQRPIEFKNDDWFYVGMADLTLGKNSVDGPLDLLSKNHLEDDFFVDGRLAFYAKGKWREKYTITASVDSQEEPIEDIFSNLDKKDPSSLLRRLEDDNHYAVYGDDSTLIEDAPTQGRFYAKINDDKSQLMWGNFIADIEDTELARVERGLYGANLHWNSEALTLFGERVANVNVFAAEAGTNAAYEELRGTGGSLYYLQHQDLTQGSERVRVEVRDKDSDLVISAAPLVAGQDYSIDALQGRVILTSPLSSISNDGLIVRTGGLSGHPTYLVVNYEYTPDFDELDNLALGGRASYWLNDSIKLGVTASKQKMELQDHKLQALDFTYRYSPQSYLKVETAQTQGQGVSGVRSNNGGYHFGDITSAVSNDDKADAYRIESAFVFSDFTKFNSTDDDKNASGKGNFYWQKRQQGFSGVGQFSQYDTEQTGVQLNLPLSESTQVQLRADTREEKGGIDKWSAELNIVQQLNEQWGISAGLRAEDSESTNANNNAQLTQNTGERTDLIVQLDYQHSEKWGALAFVQGSLSHDESKLANNRVGLGGNYQVSDAVTILGEVSGGNQGFGAQIGADYLYSDASNIYLNYELDPDRTDNGLAGRNGQFVSGARHRFTDSVNVYGEERYQHGDSRVGLTHAYGIEFAPSEAWTLGLSFENGKQEQPGQVTLTRNAIALNMGYATADFKYGTALEYREDEQVTEKRTSYLVRNNLSYKVNPDWRAQLRIDFAISDSSVADSLNSDYTEGLLGFAYRPVDNDKLNALVTYNYLYDLAPTDQFTASNQKNDYQQRSHVFAFDANYDLTSRWTFGAKYAHKVGELRQGREAGEWFDSTTSLYVVRADWHMVRHWDFLVEARMLDVKAAQDKRKGFLAAIHRHFGRNLKVGIGYNFTDFSDDLTNLDYDAKGWFINIIGKI